MNGDWYFEARIMSEEDAKEALKNGVSNITEYKKTGRQFIN